jgi:hypothetical protein
MLYRRPLGGNIYKQWELGINVHKASYRNLGSWIGWEVGWVSGGEAVLDFLVLCVFRCISVVVVEGAFVRDFRGLGLCKVAIVGWSVGDECVGGRSGLVTGWGRENGRER